MRYFQDIESSGHISNILERFLGLFYVERFSRLIFDCSEIEGRGKAMKNGWQVRELRLTVQRWQRLRASKAMEVQHDLKQIMAPKIQKTSITGNGCIWLSLAVFNGTEKRVTTQLLNCGFYAGEAPLGFNSADMVYHHRW